MKKENSCFTMFEKSLDEAKERFFSALKECENIAEPRKALQLVIGDVALCSCIDESELAHHFLDWVAQMWDEYKKIPEELLKKEKKNG